MDGVPCHQAPSDWTGETLRGTSGERLGRRCSGDMLPWIGDGERLRTPGEADTWRGGEALWSGDSLPLIMTQYNNDSEILIYVLRKQPSFRNTGLPIITESEPDQQPRYVFWCNRLKKDSQNWTTLHWDGVKKLRIYRLGNELERKFTWKDPWKTYSESLHPLPS